MLLVLVNNERLNLVVILIDYNYPRGCIIYELYRMMYLSLRSFEVLSLYTNTFHGIEIIHVVGSI